MQRAASVLFAAQAFWQASAAGLKPLTPAQALEAFQIEPPCRIELVAAEPLVQSPCALAWDESGRLFVAENPGYPIGPESGAIVELVDTNRDGQADQRLEFATGLGYPNGLTPWRGGWLVTDAPHLYWLVDTNQDGRADLREIWFTGFATQGTTQLRACYPTLGPDGWVYVARGLSGGVITSPKWPHLAPVDLQAGDFRFRPDGSAAEAIGGNAQFGLVLDDAGRRFLVSNRNPLMHAVLERRWWQRNPFLPWTDQVQDVAAAGYQAKVYPRSQDTTTAGYSADFLGAPHAGTFTSACGIHQFFGEELPEPFQGSWFICEPAQNLVQRQIATPAGATFQSAPATPEREFLASTDTWFHPVCLQTGPDGALYVADLYRQNLDHPDYLPEDARQRLDFDAGKAMGRIWRILGTQFEPRPRDILDASKPDWFAELRRPNIWARQTAHRLLLEDWNPSTPRRLESLLSNTAPVDADWERFTRLSEEPPFGPHLIRARALRLLAETLEHHPDPDGQGALRGALFDASPTVRAVGWRICLGSMDRFRAWLGQAPPDLWRWWADDPNAAVRFHIALLCGERADESPALEALIRIVRSDAHDRWTRAAVLSGVAQNLTAFLSALFRDPVPDTAGSADLLAEVGQMLGSNPDAPAGEFLEAVLAFQAEGRAWQTAALAGYSTGLRSRGAPPLRDALGQFNRNPGHALDLSNRLAAVAVRAGQTALDQAAPWTARLTAIRLLGEWEFAQAQSTLRTLLEPSSPPKAQEAAARALAQFDRAEATRLLLDSARWPHYAPATRETIVAQLAAQSRQLPALLDALESETIPLWSIDPQRRRQWQQHRDASIQNRARRIFAEAGGSDRRRVYEGYRSVLDLSPDPNRGRDVFVRVCAPCHQHGPLGVNVGPDLTGVRNQPAQALLLHILMPDAEIYAGYQSYDVETKDGRALAGLLVAETSSSITLRRAGAEEVSLRRDNLHSMTANRVSFMPSELEKTMTRQELADLIGFLKSPTAPGRDRGGEHEITGRNEP